MIIKDRGELGKFLKNRREGLSLSKYRVSKDIGVSSSTIFNIEEGAVNYSIDHLLAYVSELGLALEINVK